MTTNDIEGLQQIVADARAKADQMSDFRDRAQAEYDQAVARYDDTEESDPAYTDVVYAVLKAEVVLQHFAQQSHEAWRVHGGAEQALDLRLGRLG